MSLIDLHNYHITVHSIMKWNGIEFKPHHEYSKNNNTDNNDDKDINNDINIR